MEVNGIMLAGGHALTSLIGPDRLLSAPRLSWIARNNVAAIL